MIVRLAKHEDLNDIVEIYNQAIMAGKRTADITTFTVKDRLEWFESHDSEKYPLFVAIKNEKVVGYLTLGPYRPGRAALQHTAEVSFYVHFSHHKQGVASEMLRHGISICNSLGIKTLLAILIEENEGSIRLLKKHGFQEWGRLPEIVEFDRMKYDHLYYGLHL